MRRDGTESGLLAFCRKLSREVLQFADPLRPTLGGKQSGNLKGRQRSLNIEPLEIRSYLNGTSVTAQVDPIWFQDVSDSVQNHAGTANWTTSGITASNNEQSVSVAGASDSYDWIVQFDTQSVTGITNIAQTASLLTGSGIQFQTICGLGIVGHVLMRSSGASLDAVADWLAADSDVAAYEQDAVRQIQSTPNDTSLSQLWGMSKIDAYSAWNLTTGKSGANSVVVAVIDTGADYTHSDLAANIWTNPNAGKDGFGNDLHGYDFANNDSDPMDDNGHGTHVAGTIGAVGNNGLGVAGINWAVSIMPLKFMTASGSGYLSDAIRAINYVTMERTQYGVNVRVINASWGGGTYSAAMQTAIQAAGNAGILFVAAAGNDGKNNDASPSYPSGYNCNNIIAVAASDQNDRLASFSNYGASTVDLAAPGVSIYSTLPGNKYGSYSGTSMATPQVAGAAALAWAMNPSATVADIRYALMQGTDHPSYLAGKVATGGRLNVFHTLQILQGGSPTSPTIGSLTVSASSIQRGAAFDLIASGAASPSGSVTAVYFYQDVNGNNSYDNSDFPVGADYTIVGGVGTLHFASTKNWTPGTYTFFARTLDSSNQLGSAATTTLTITPAGMSSFAISSSSVVQGTAVSLVSQGVAAGNIGVYYYQETTGNGVYDAKDFPLGASMSIVNGTAQLTFNTANWTPGSYRFYARALNANYQLGDAFSQTLTITAKSDSTPTPDPSKSDATSIAVGSTLSGKLESSKKECLYQFLAVAGTSYSIRTTLGTLRDSTLHLYDSDAKTQLAFNDDGDSGLASKITWVASKTGTFYFKVSAFDKTLTGDFRVSLASNANKTLAVNSLATLTMQTAASPSNEISSTAYDFTKSGLHSEFTHSDDAVAIPVQNSSTSTATVERDSSLGTSLLNRPAVRNALHSMLFEEVLNLADPVQSLQIHLDALDEFFARFGI